MIAVKVLKVNSDHQIPAEIRSVEKDAMIILMKDFETATLISKTFVKDNGNVWKTADGQYSCVVPTELLDGQEILIKVPKK